MITRQSCRRLALLATLVAAYSCGANDGPATSSSPTSPSSAGLSRVADFAGSITSMNVGARTIVVSGRTVNVSAAAIHRGNRNLQVSDLKVAQRVRVRGSMADSIVMASDVDVQEGDQSGDNDNDDNDDDGNNQTGNHDNQHGGQGG